MNNTSSYLRGLAEQHEDAARKLRDAADVVDGIGSTAPPGKPEPPANNAPKEHRSRLDELYHLLKTKGPMKRKEILAVSEIPSGTIGMLLKPPKFTKNDEGRWGVTENGVANDVNA